MNKTTLGALLSEFGTGADYTELAEQTFDYYLGVAHKHHDRKYHQLLTKKLKDLLARFLSPYNRDKYELCTPIEPENFEFDLKTQNGLKIQTDQVFSAYASNDSDIYLFVYFTAIPDLENIEQFILLDIISYKNGERDTTLSEYKGRDLS